jgi:hypothetical protein
MNSIREGLKTGERIAWSAVEKKTLLEKKG